MRWYVLNVTITSSGAEQRTFTPYDDEVVATRKFYEPFNSIGAGPQKITVILFDSNLNIVKREQWIQEAIAEESEVES